MFFKNLTLFRFATDVAGSFDVSLDNVLLECALRPIGPLEARVTGFVSPMGRNDDRLVRWCGNSVLMALGAEEKILPAAVVHEELAHRIQLIVEEQARRVGAKERSRIKDEIVTQFLAKAFVRPSRCMCYADVANGWLVIDNGSRKIAEEVVTALREAFGTFPVTPMAPEESPRTLMTSWVAFGHLPDGFALGDEVDLRDPGEHGSAAKFKNQDLETDEIRDHIKTGKQVFQLGLTFDGRISFVLGEDLVVRRVRFLDEVLDELGKQEQDSADMEIDSRFALMSLEFARLLAKLDEIFVVPRAEAHLRLTGQDAPRHMRAAA